MSDVYKPLRIPIYPLNGDISEFDLPNQNNFFSTSFLNLELISFFESNGVSLTDTFNITKINVTKIPTSRAFTDGEYNRADHHRLCAINWNFSFQANTVVKFFSTEGATPTYNALKDHTQWDDVFYVAADDYADFGPLLLNPQIPYVYSGNEDPALILSLSFKENWQSINEKLENFIITST